VRITFRSAQPFEAPLSLFVREGHPLDRESLELASLKRLPRFE
jgi:hypothetical protein